MQLRGSAKRTITSARGPASAASLPSGLVRSLQDIERDVDLPESHDDLDHRPVIRTRR